MTDDPAKLTPANPDDLCQALAFALTFDGRRRFQPSSEMMAKITAEHLAGAAPGAMRICGDAASAGPRALDVWRQAGCSVLIGADA